MIVDPSLIAIIGLAILLTLNEALRRLRHEDLPLRADPLVWLCLPLGICLLCYLAPIVDHRDQLRLIHALELIGFCFCFLIGGVLYRFMLERSSDPKLPKDNEALVTSPRNLVFLLVVGMIGFAATFADQVIITNIGVIERLSLQNLDAVRASRNAASVTGEQGPFHIFESLSAFSVLFIIAVISSRLADSSGAQLERWTRIASVAIVLYVAFSTVAVTGGRIQLVLLFLLVLYSLMLDRRFSVVAWVVSNATVQRFAFIALIAVAFGGMVMYFSTAYVQNRLRTADTLLILKIAHRAEPAGWLKPAVQDSPNLQGALFQYSYLTTPISTFAYYSDLSDSQMPGPYLGQYNFWGFADRILRRFDLAESTNPSLESYRPLVFHGYGSNVWRTAFVDYALDVGFAGVYFIMFFMGFVARWICILAYRTGHLVWIAAGSSILTLLVFSPFHALFNRGSMVTAILFWAFLYGLFKVLRLALRSWSLVRYSAK